MCDLINFFRCYRIRLNAIAESRHKLKRKKLVGGGGALATKFGRGCVAKNMQTKALRCASETQKDAACAVAFGADGMNCGSIILNDGGSCVTV